MSRLGARSVVRVVPLAGSVAWKQLTDDPVRAVVLAHRLTPRRLKALVNPVLVRTGGPLARAVIRWDESRDVAVPEIEVITSPRVLRRLASFALAVDRPDVAALAIDRLPETDRVRPPLLARLAHREGRMRDALDILGDPPPNRRAARLRPQIEGELGCLDPGRPRVDAGSRRRLDPVPGRVLHLVTNALPYKKAGYTVRTQRIALAQRAVGVDAHVVTRLGFPVAQGNFDGRTYVEIDGVPYHRLLPRTLPGEAADALDRGIEMAGELVERLRPAILHAASNHVNGQIALALRDRFGLPVVYEVRGFLEESWLSRAGARDAGSDYYRRSRELETHCMREADLVVTLSAAMADEIAGRGVPADNIVVVPNAVDEAFLGPLPDGDGLRARLGVPEGAVVIGTASTFYRHEGIDTLLRAGAELRRRGAPAYLLLVGDGPELPALRHLAAELDLGDAVAFPGRVPYEEVRRYHGALDVFAVPRTNDRVCHLVTPLKPVEAMAGGLPVVASDVKAMRELVEPGVTGALIPPEHPRALADVLERLIYSPSRLAYLGWRSREKVTRDRTWRAAAHRYRTAYATLRGCSSV